MTVAMAARVGALVIACGGRTRFARLRELARHHGQSNRAVKAAVAELEDEKLVRIEGDGVVALDEAELAAYVADELDDLHGGN